MTCQISTIEDHFSRWHAKSVLLMIIFQDDMPYQYYWRSYFKMKCQISTIEDHVSRWHAKSVLLKIVFQDEMPNQYYW